MARRPIFSPIASGEMYILESYVDFTWHAGMSLKQKQRSIDELHKEASQKFSLHRPLEISSKSDNPLGVALSSFNLKFRTHKGRLYTVEAAFQGSKVFKDGGPYIDILEMSPKDAKRDPRLKDSGSLVGFRFFREDWPIIPRTAFYDWIYINALVKNKDLAQDVLSFDYFTDIEFNPERSVNCQARSLAIYIALLSRGILEKSLASPEEFRKIYSNIPKPHHVNYHNPLI